MLLLIFLHPQVMHGDEAARQTDRRGLSWAGVLTLSAFAAFFVVAGGRKKV